jgi:hypothetical protein
VAQRFDGSYNDCLKKKPKATNCSDHRTISLIAHTANIVARILRRRIERKTEDALGENQFGFRRGKRNKGYNWDAENNIRKKLGHR